MVKKTADDSEGADPVTVVDPSSPAVQRFRLRGRTGELAGKTFDSSSDRLQLGSHPLNQIEIAIPTISRFHCEVFVGPDGRVWVKDLGSRNGTRVNGVRIHEAELAEGAVLQLSQLHVRAPGGTKRAPGCRG